jgi:MscS family membrane protein
MTRTIRVASHLAAAVLSTVVAASVARGQTPGPSTAPPAPTTRPAPATAPAPAATPLTDEELAKPMGPADPFNRGTPRGAAYGFARATRDGDYERAAEYLDLRRLPPEDQERAPEIARQLRAALGRSLPVDFASFSDRPEGYSDDGLPAWQDELGVVETSEGMVTLLLQRVPREGDGMRIWKISADTVARTHALYQEFGPGWLESWLPAFFLEVRVLRLTLADWVGLVLVALAGWLVSALLAAPLIRILARLFTRRGELLDERTVRLVRGPVRMALTILAFHFGRRDLIPLDLKAEQLFSHLDRLLWIAAIAWLLFRLIDIAAIGLRMRAEHRGNLGIIPSLPPLQRITRILVVALGTLAMLSGLGIDVTAALAGLGVGGIAIALAAQKSLENLLGGISLFADQPVRVGDFFRYGNEVGTVEEIGLRSTRVRTLERTVVTIPNAEFSNLRLENFARRDRMWLRTSIGVRYETSPDQLRFLLVKLRQILLAHPRVTDDPARVRLIGFGACSIDIEVFAYVDTADWNEFLAIREDVYLRFIDAVREAGTGFAFPSSTTYVGRDSGLDQEDARRAEATVAAWREKGELPFPDFPEQARREVWNTLEWPPSGSARTAVP